MGYHKVALCLGLFTPKPCLLESSEEMYLVQLVLWRLRICSSLTVAVYLAATLYNQA